MSFVIRTARLQLREWRAADREAFAALNADRRVMEFFPETLSRPQSEIFADRIASHFAAHGFGLWAAEIPGVTTFAGYVGLAVPRFTAHFTPCVEIGWRLAAAYWNQGYATEAAHAVLDYGFTTLELPEIVSFAVPMNRPSIRVMEKIGLTRNPGDDFDHPAFAPDHRLCRHVLYRKRRPLMAVAADGGSDQQ
jgi:RimJ/RimL family protein N-acetyltransferase